MAGDWMKVELSTPDKPEIWMLAHILEISRTHVLGMLMVCWSWLNTHTTDGKSNVPPGFFDDLVGHKGFCDAMVEVGWFTVEQDAVVMVNFAKHNGQSAKKRAQDNVRKGAQRARDAVGSRTDRDQRREEKEKSREEKKQLPPYPPEGGNNARGRACVREAAPDEVVAGDKLLDAMVAQSPQTSAEDGLPSDDTSCGGQPKSKSKIPHKARLEASGIDFSGLPDEIPDRLIEDWLVVRKGKKAAVTQSAVDALVQELEKSESVGWTPIEAMTETVSRGWGTLRLSYLDPKKLSESPSVARSRYTGTGSGSGSRDDWRDRFHGFGTVDLSGLVEMPDGSFRPK